MRRRGCLIAIVVALVIVLAAGLVAAVGYYRVQAAYEPKDLADSRKIRIILEPGSTGQQIAARLEEAGVIRDARLFIVVARLEGYDGRFQAGDYVLMPSMKAVEIMEALSHGRSHYVPLTIPEGYTLGQIADRIEEAELGHREGFLAYATSAGPLEIGGFSITSESLEGYLFPDTYYVPEGAKPEDIAGMMLSRFREVVLEGFREDLQNSDLSLHEVVTIASVVEREAQLAEERPTVAQVFLLRIEKGMKLESCATVQYLLDKPVPVITAKEMAIDSPYNTYIYAGLPPGPIGSPGRSCIEAVLHPSDTDYLYFRTRGDGGHHFTHTFEEHLAAGR